MTTQYCYDRIIDRKNTFRKILEDGTRFLDAWKAKLINLKKKISK